MMNLTGLHAGYGFPLVVYILDLIVGGGGLNMGKLNYLEADLLLHTM